MDCRDDDLITVRAVIYIYIHGLVQDCSRTIRARRAITQFEIQKRI